MRIKAIDFYNPIEQIISAALKISPSLKCLIQFDPNLANPPYGETIWLNDGEIVISLSTALSIIDLLEILAHELAHVIAGHDAEHGEKWELAFSRIWEEYHKEISGNLR